MTERQERCRQRILEWLKICREEIDAASEIAPNEEQRRMAEAMRGVLSKCTDEELVYFTACLTGYMKHEGIVTEGPGPLPRVAPPRPKFTLVPQEED